MTQGLGYESEGSGGFHVYFSTSEQRQLSRRLCGSGVVAFETEGTYLGSDTDTDIDVYTTDTDTDTPTHATDDFDDLDVVFAGLALTSDEPYVETNDDAGNAAADPDATKDDYEIVGSAPTKISSGNLAGPVRRRPRDRTSAATRPTARGSCSRRPRTSRTTTRMLLARLRSVRLAASAPATDALGNAGTGWARLTLKAPRQ